jgi:hypothetical protein
MPFDGENAEILVSAVDDSLAVLGVESDLGT